MSDGTIVFLCPACGYKARIPTQYAGHTIRCPGCQSPQIAHPAAPSMSTGKTISIMKVASTPVPFTLPPDQAAALAAASTTPLPMELGIQAVGVAPGIPVLGNPSGLRPRIDTPLPDNTPRANVALPVASKPAAGATIDFTCTSCHARMRIPAQYVGKSILCPKCSAPQKVIDAKTPAQPMDTTRSLKSGEPTQTPPLPGLRIARPPSGEILPQTAPQYMPPPLDAAPTQVHKSDSDSALARAGVPRRRGVGDSGTGVHSAPQTSAPIPPPPRAVEPSEESSVIPSDHLAAEPTSKSPGGNSAKVVRSGRKPAASASSSSDSAATVPVSPRGKSTSSSSSLLPVLAIGFLLVAALGGCGWLWMQLSAAEARTAEVEQAKSKAQAKAVADLAAVEARLTVLEQQLKEAQAAVEAAEEATKAAAATAAETPVPAVVPESTTAPSEAPAQAPAP